MSLDRRRFLSTSLVAGAGVTALPACSASANADSVNDNYAKLDEVISAPGFKRELFKEPVIIESVELLRDGRSFICRVRSKDGAEGIAESHNTMSVLYPIFLNRVQNVFVGQDARHLDELLDKALEFSFNYRFGGVGIGIPLATMEFAILDMMGFIAGKPVGELVGEIHNTHIPVYQATEWRDKSVDESVALIKEAVEKSQATAVKIKVGALMFMTKDLDARGPSDRTEQIIPKIREAFGDDMTLYSDANGYYRDSQEAIRVGKLLQEYNYAYFEEPVFFDWLDGNKEVTDALDIPIAGGEQQHSIYGFRWLLANEGIDVVQPDHFYFGGIIRSLKVARMGHAMGKTCIPHLSGGLGYLYMLHLVSAMPNRGAHIEFKGYERIPIECATSSLRLENGRIQVPTGPGLGIEIDPDYLKRYRSVREA